MRNSLITATRTASLFLICLGMISWAIPMPQSANGRIRNSDRPSASPTLAGEVDRNRVRTLLRNMPLQFIENGGQVDPSVAYYVQGRDTSLYFSNRGVRFAMTEKTAPPSLSHDGQTSPLKLVSPLTSSSSVVTRRAWALNLDFIGADRRVKPRAEDATPTVINYFKGNHEHDQWRTGLTTYRKLIYENLWRGIDLIYCGDNDSLKYTFVVKPGADPNQIRLAYRGATAVKVNEGGQLEVTTPVRSFQDEKPYSYQETSAGRSEVVTSYKLESRVTANGQTYGFQVGAYNRTKPLLIDPAIIVYAGYLGGDHEERALGIAVDNAGNAYITGESTSTALSFPATTGSFLTTGGGQDAFVAKLNAAGTAFIYCAYLGGAGNDAGFGIAADSSGNAYVVGATSSPEASFPIKVGPDLTYNGGSFDAFVAKIDPTGTSLVYCGYIGGAGAEGGAGIAVDSGGNAYVTGATSSTEGSFPVSVGPDLTFNGGFFVGDAFVAKVNATGTALPYCGFIGGAGEDVATSIAVDADGNAYLTGGTNSTEASFPVKAGPDLTYNGGLRDGWVAKVSAGGSSLAYCGYIGGNGADLSYDIAVDSAGCIYVTGETSSTEASFPVKVGPDLTYNGGSFDAFVVKLNATGTDFIYSGYLGGSGRDWATGIAIDALGAAYITGASHSSESSFPVGGGPDLTFNGGAFYGDGFVAKVTATGTALAYCSYIGGASDEVGYGIALDSHDSVYVVGETSSTQASFPIASGPDLTYNGGVRDGFVVKLSENQPPIARCHDVIKIADRNVSAQEVDAGSSDPEGDPITLGLSPTGPYAPGTTAVTLTATDDKGAASQCAAEITIRRGTPTVGWRNPSDIRYGTPLSATQLNASASFNNVAVPGTLIYMPAANTVLAAGNARTLSVTFMPTDTVSYDPASATVTINVTPAPLTITANDRLRIIGAPNPPFTASYSGFVPGQNPQVLSGTLTFATMATATSNVGNYAVIPSGLTSSNYALTYAAGRLTVSYNILLVDSDDDDDDDDDDHDRRGDHHGEHHPIIPQLCAATNPCVLSGDSEQLRLRLVDAAGRNMSAASITLHVQNLLRITGAGLVPVSSDQDFRFRMPPPNHQSCYAYEAGDLRPGTYLLRFRTGTDPTLHAVQFSVR